MRHQDTVKLSLPSGFRLFSHSMLIMIAQNKVIVWNCRGAANKSVFRIGNQYALQHKPEVFVVMETRCDPTKLGSPLKRMRFGNILSAENNGFTGSIVIAWERGNISIDMISKNSQYIHVRVSEPKDIEWVFHSHLC